MQQAPFIENITRKVGADGIIRALALSGSFGRGSADRFSDIDLVALAAPDTHEGIAAYWRETLESLAPVVFWNEQRGGGILLNAITDSWLRCDLLIRAPERFHLAQDRLVPLIDEDRVFAALPKRSPPPQPDRDKIARTVREFIRVIGLLPVVMARADYETARRGAEILRQLLVDLMVEETASPDRGGALHLNRLLTAEQSALLAALPVPLADAAVSTAHRAIAALFMPRAHAMCQRLGLEWPAAFEAAARRHLLDELGFALDPTSADDQPAVLGTPAAVHIRPFAKTDAARVTDLCIAAFTPIHAGFREALGEDLFGREYRNWREGYRRTIAAVDSAHPTDRVFVAEAGGTIAGFVFTHLHAERGVGEIGLNAVDPAFQGRGIGQTMYRFVLDDLKARGAIGACVGTGGDAAHAPARKAYRAVGFDRQIPSLHLYREL